MLRENNRKIRTALQLTDLVIVAASFFLAYEARRQWDGVFVPLRPLSSYMFLLYMILPLWTALFSFNGAYGSIRTKSLYQTVKPLLKTTLAGGVVLMTILFIFRLEYISRALLLMFLMISGFLLVALRALILSFTQYIRRKGYNYRTVVIVGTGRRAEAYARALEEHREWGVKVIGFVELSDDSRAGNVRVIGTIENLETIITTLQVDEVVFVVPRKWLDRIEEQIIVCEQVGIKASIAADFYPHTIAKVRMEELMGWPL
ncbi:MAG: hypothetical protein Q8P48_05410, partial [Deltaproteobacteria bacterium]|nr:hypothetical protein [Deltaproteobacteria bacterium]